MAGLVASDNRAVSALARTCKAGMVAVVAGMNDVARRAGAVGTVFVEPTGLSPSNVSSAKGVAKILSLAERDEAVSSMSGLEGFVFRWKNGERKYANTNPLARDNPEGVRVEISKTGYIDESGWSVAMTLVTDEGRFRAVVLGAQTRSERDRLARRLVSMAKAGKSQDSKVD